MAVVGIGNMGTNHAEYIQAGKVSGAELTAVCDINPKKIQAAKKRFGTDIDYFDSVDSLIKSGKADAVLIAVPHYDHPPTAVKCFRAGLHVLTEKPAGVYTKQVREMNEAADASGKVFGIMYNQRTNPLYQKLRQMINNGELGEMKRMNWIMTSWYRSQSYYDSGGWRATWAGEGGGVLLNQDPHQLDLWQWCLGMPKRLRAFCYYGKHHNIEAEDDVTAFVEYENGATGVFVTTTGDTPGTNRLEVTGDRGKIVVEDGTLIFWRLEVPERHFNREYRGGFGEPDHWKCEVPIIGVETGHPGITADFVRAVERGSGGGKGLLAPGAEGIKGLSISNAMHLSSWTDDWVELPPDEELFYQKLRERIAGSTFTKKQTEDKTLEIRKSF